MAKANESRREAGIRMGKQRKREAAKRALEAEERKRKRLAPKKVPVKPGTRGIRGTIT